MKAKVTEVCGEIFINDELFHTCTTTLAELKEMWEYEKIWKECKEMFEYDKHINVAVETLKNSPRKFTIEQIDNVCMEVYKGIIKTKTEIINYLTKLPPEGLEVEIENNKIVKVYV